MGLGWECNAGMGIWREGAFGPPENPLMAAYQEHQASQYRAQYRAYKARAYKAQVIQVIKQSKAKYRAYRSQVIYST